VTPRTVRHPGELRWETRLLGMVTAVLVVFGVAATYGAASLVKLQGQSAGFGFALRQLSGAAMGGILLLLASRLDYYRWRQLAWPLLLVTLILLLIPLLPFTHAIAPPVNGARRWLDLGPINFQPSELARLVVVIWCAMLASKKGLQVREFKKGVLPFILILGLVSVLILLEPNLSMATLVALLGGLVLFTSGAKIGHFVLLTGAGMILVFHQIRDAQYRLARLVTFMPAFRSSNRWWGSDRGRSSALDSGKASRSWATCPTPIPTSCSAPSVRNGDSSASWWSLPCFPCSAGWGFVSPRRPPTPLASISLWASPRRLASRRSCTWPFRSASCRLPG
jgi:hypothetical protein